jgi:mRNA-degrading endonuclease HigB of HigAB toxin-antitoxin module
MKINGLNVLLKFAKNNATLRKSLDEFVRKVQAVQWTNDADVKATFQDADRIFGNAYVLNLTKSDRTLTVLYFKAGELDIVWVGDHQAYDRDLKNNPNTIKKLLRKKGYDV